jgi:hypothetical protein
MRFIAWNMALAGWLLFSAFLMGHSPESAAMTGLLAVFVGTVAIGSPGLPGLRFVNAILALVLAGAALFMPDNSWLARINDLILAALIFALAVIPGRSWGGSIVQEGDAKP